MKKRLSIKECEQQKREFLSNVIDQNWSSIQTMINQNRINPNVLYHISEMPLDFLDMLETAVDFQYKNQNIKHHDKIQVHSVYQTYMKQNAGANNLFLSARDIVFFYKQYHVLQQMHGLNNNGQWQNYFLNVRNNVHINFDRYIQKINLTDFIDKEENIKNVLYVLKELTENKSKIIDDIFSHDFDFKKYSSDLKNQNVFELKNYYKEQKMAWVISNDFVDFIRKSDLNQKTIEKYFNNFYHKIKLDQNEDILIDNLKSMEKLNKKYFLKNLFSDKSLDVGYLGLIADKNDYRLYKKDKTIYDRVLDENNKSFEHFIIDHIHYKKKNSKLKHFMINAPDFLNNLKQSINKNKLQLKNANQLNQMLDLNISTQNIDTNYLKHNLETALKKENKLLLKKQCDILIALYQNSCHEILNSVITKDSLNGIQNNPKVEQSASRMLQNYALKDENQNINNQSNHKKSPKML